MREIYSRAQRIVENLRKPLPIGRLTYWFAEQSNPVVHHDLEATTARNWLLEGNSLVIVYGPHTSIWDFPIPEQKFVYPTFINSDPNKHIVIASAKFNTSSSRTLDTRKRLHVPHMGIANIALQQYTELMGISIVYMVPEALKKKLIQGHPGAEETIEAWASEINTKAIDDLTCVLDQDGAIVEYFPEATRHDNTFIRGELLLDVLHAKFRHKTRQLGVLPIALFGMETIQPAIQQGTIIGINPKTSIHLDVLPFRALRELKAKSNTYHWSNPPDMFDPRVYASDVILKLQSLSDVVPSPPTRPGIYASLIEKTQQK